MGTKAPDTRNKLESIRIPKKRKPIKHKAFKEIKSLPIKVNVEKKKTKGQLFKEATGISKTTKRLLNKHGLTINMLENYKEIRKARKKVATKARQEKHKASATYKRLNSKKGKGSATPGKKKK